MGTPNSVIQPMQKVQNAAARLNLRAPRHQHCTPFLQQLHWLPISKRIKYKTVCMCYNSINGSTPSYLSKLLPFPLSPLFIRHSILKLRRFNRKTRGFRSFSYFGHHIWNNFPQDVKNKNKFKTFLFSEHFS